MLRLTGSMDVKWTVTFEPEAAQGTDVSSISIADANVRTSCSCIERNSNIHLTIVVSSPGKTRSLSPTCMIPPDNLPDTAAHEFCPLKTLDIGRRNGLCRSRTGGASLSASRQNVHTDEG